MLIVAQRRPYHMEISWVVQRKIPSSSGRELGEPSRNALIGLV